MAKLTPQDEINLVSDWKTGRYSQRDLASKYNCSKGKVSQLTEGIEKAKNDGLYYYHVDGKTYLFNDIKK